MQKIFFLIFLILTCILLVSCHTLQQKDTVYNFKKIQQWQNHEVQIRRIIKYQTRGTFFFLSKNPVVYTNFFWEQITPNHFYLFLINPLCSNQVEMNFSSDVIQITDNQGRYYITNDVDEIIQKLTGIRIPLKKLRLWILGLPGEATDCILDNQYRLQCFTYNDDNITWRVNYLKYARDTEPSLPSQLEIIEGDQIFKLQINNWTLQK